MFRNNKLFADQQRRNPNKSPLYRTIASSQYYINSFLLQVTKEMKEKLGSHAISQSIGDVIQLSRTGLGMILCSLFSILLYQLRDSGYYRTSFDSHVAIKLRTMKKDNEASDGTLNVTGKGHSNSDIRNPQQLFNFLRKIHADEYPQLIQRMIGIIASNPNEKVTKMLLPIKQFLRDKYPHILVDFSSEPNSISHKFISLVGIRPRETICHTSYEQASSSFFAENQLGLIHGKQKFSKTNLLDFVERNGVGIFGPHYLFSGSVRIDHTDPEGFGNGKTGDIISFKHLNSAYLELKSTEDDGVKTIHTNRKLVKKGQYYFLVHTDSNKHSTRKKVDHTFIENYSLKYYGEKFYQSLHQKYGYNSAAIFTILQVTILNKLRKHN